MLDPKPAYSSEPPPPPVPLRPSRPPGRAPLVTRPMSIAAAAGWTLGATFVFVWLLSLVVSLRPAARDDLVTSFGCQVVAYLVTLFGILRVHAPDGSIRELLGFRRTHGAFYPLAVLLGLAIVLPANTLYEVLERRFPSHPGHEDRLVELLLAAGPARRVAIGLVVVLLGPLLEEVFFRGALLTPMRRRHAIPAAVLATSVLFAMAHESWQMMLPIALVGCALGVLRVASGSLVPSVLLHATFNAVPFVSVLTAENPLDHTPEPPNVPGLAVSTLGAALVLFAVRHLATHTDAAKSAQENDLR